MLEAADGQETGQLRDWLCGARPDYTEADPRAPTPWCDLRRIAVSLALSDLEFASNYIAR